MVPGTNMTFAGIPRGKERADLITFLNTKSDKPVELPKQAAAAAGRGARPSRSERQVARSLRARRIPASHAVHAELMWRGGHAAGGQPSKNRHNRLSIVACS